jgi:2-iminobutanoate/2-iminopropanoate deaminase
LLGLSNLRAALEKFMARDIIKTTRAPAPPPTCSQAVRAAGLVFVSGTGPYDPETGKIVGETFRADETVPDEYICDPRQQAVRSDRIASATVILLDEADFAGMNEEAGGSREPAGAAGCEAAGPFPVKARVDCRYRRSDTSPTRSLCNARDNVM